MKFNPSLFKIMIVDDSDQCNQLLKKNLRATGEPLEIIDFTESRMAYDWLNMIDPDLIFLDGNIPTFKTHSFLRKLKQEKKSIPAVIITATPFDDCREIRAVNYDFIISYLPKPVRLDYVRDCISQFMHDRNRRA